MQRRPSGRSRAATERGGGRDARARPRGRPPRPRPPATSGRRGHGGPARPAGGRIAGPLALLAGWALALAVLLPPALAPDAASALILAAALAFWALAVRVVRSDLAHYVIPDGASAALAALGLALAAGLAWLAGDGRREAASAVLDAAATGAGAFALFWAIGAAFRALGRDALGHGDVKLAGALAVWLSPADAALALELAALAAASRSSRPRRAALARRPLRDTAVPFGAFMAPAAWLVLVLAPPLRDAGWLPW